MELRSSYPCCSKFNCSSIMKILVRSCQGRQREKFVIRRHSLTQAGGCQTDPTSSSFSHKSRLGHQCAQWLWASHSRQPGVCSLSCEREPHGGREVVLKVRESVWSYSWALPLPGIWGHLTFLRLSVRRWGGQWKKATKSTKCTQTPPRILWMSESSVSSHFFLFRPLFYFICIFIIKLI